MKEEFFNNIRNLCMKSMTYEVLAAPKPGLVDRFNNGAHKDMDLFTFVDSTISLSSYYYDITKIGFEFNKGDYKLLMEEIRPIGIEAEKTMFAATNGINTHKGLIFLMGIIAAAAGSLHGRVANNQIKPKDISKVVMEVARGITEELKIDSNNKKLTYGERIFKEYNILGIRGEVEKGLPTVMNISYPIFKKLMDSRRYSINMAMIHTLIHLLTVVDDINILGRHDMDMLIYVRKRSKEALKLGGYLTPKGRKYVKYMDRDFINRNISPGGSADLLAVTMLLYFIEGM